MHWYFIVVVLWMGTDLYYHYSFVEFLARLIIVSFTGWYGIIVPLRFLRDRLTSLRRSWQQHGLDARRRRDEARERQRSYELSIRRLAVDTQRIKEEKPEPAPPTREQLMQQARSIYDEDCRMADLIPDGLVAEAAKAQAATKLRQRLERLFSN